MRRPAAFLDRDGTIIADAGYLSDPAGVELLPGAAPGLRRLAGAGFALVIATNQSGIARGLYAEADFRAVQARLTAELAEHGVALAGVYHCPHHPDHTGPCDCRKPAAGMFLRASEELELDLGSSIFVGDSPRDVRFAAAVGARAFLVDPSAAAPVERGGATVVANLDAVADLVLGTAAPLRE
jgi:D-glycero-D-manno-heptose 1,7-bisphosphate phosphatase